MEARLEALKQEATSASSSASVPILTDNDSDSGSMAGSLDDFDLPQDSRGDDENWEDVIDEASHRNMVDGSVQYLEAICGTGIFAKHLTPDEAADQLYERWKALIPSLVPPLLQYMDSTQGKEWARPSSTLKSKCTQGDSCPKTTHTVTALLFACKYLGLTAGLPQLKPDSSRFPRVYGAVTAMSAALNASYRKRAFIVTNAQGNKVKEPFRKGLGYALQWYDCILVEVERQKAQAVASKFYELFKKFHSEAQSLYTVINVSDDFPALKGVDLEFVRRLYLLREIKATVQRKATSTFWEFDKLDRAAGGKDIALGTKMHQHVRSSMSKKTAALTATIKRYNTECQALAAMRPPGCQIPIPDPLPTSMAELKKDTSLMENVWIEPVTDDSHRWVHDQDVRDGIRAMLRLKRCREERRRLGVEADNMLRWYQRELQAISAAIDDPSNLYLVSQLRLQFEEVAALKSTWATTLIPEASYDAHLGSIRQSAGSSPLTWVPIILSDELMSSSELDVLAAEADFEHSQAEAAEHDPSMRPSVEEVCFNDLYEEQVGLEVTAQGEVSTPPYLHSDLAGTE
ncbi:hypothetical protein H1R20_g2362, partial [Candolleomyces eurysporus]